MKKKKDFLEYEENLDYDIYDGDYVEILLDDDELTDEEEAFMRGYNES